MSPITPARLITAGLTAVLLLGTGCLSASVMQQANTVGKGRKQFVAENGFWDDLKSGQKMPNGGFSARFGVTDDVDLGVRLGESGIELLTKFQLTSPTEVVVSVAPAIGASIDFFHVDTANGFALLPTTVLTTKVPVLIGAPVGRHQIVLSGSLQDAVTFDGSGRTANALSVGGSAGFAFRFSDSFKVMPEVALLFPVQQWSGRTNVTDTPAGTSGVFLTFGLGFFWGDSR